MFAGEQGNGVEIVVDRPDLVPTYIYMHSARSQEMLLTGGSTSHNPTTMETAVGGNTLDRRGNVLVCGRETIIYRNTSLLPYIL